MYGHHSAVSGARIVDNRIHIFFFFKQKTAYEMRISDWSSDVCSSDLGKRALGCVWHIGFLREVGQAARSRTKSTVSVSTPSSCVVRRPRRSEEHTSELQSLMRIPYAVFCLKKKTSEPHTLKINS